MALPVLVINRSVDTDRLARFRASADAHGIAFDVVEALDAHAPDFPFARHAALIGDSFWGEQTIKPGAVGCFLSHRKAWQRVLDQGLDHALICEDDAGFHEGTMRVQALVAATPQAEVIFVNDRLTAWAGAAGMAEISQLDQMVTALAVLGGPTAMSVKPTPGGDAYVLTAKGAARLLEITARQRIQCGVDWAMVRASMDGVDDTVAAAFPELGRLRDLTPANSLESYVLSRPVAGQVGGVPSTIRHRITVPIADLKR